MNRIFTSYGYKLKRQSPFVIIAPHASGDDQKTATITRQLAERLGASMIVNRKFFKPENRKAKDKPAYIEDFNQLRWSQLKNQYLWSSKKVAMYEFFKDVSRCCDNARKYATEHKSIAVYIHGIRDKEIGVDLGVGIKARGDRNKFAESLSSTASNSGRATIKISKLKKIRRILNEGMQEKFKLIATVGCIFIGWSRRSAIQFHKHEGRNDYAIQLELNKKVRRKESREQLIELLADSLEKTFNQK